MLLIVKESRGHGRTGRRRVDSMELEKMIRLYELNFRDLFAEEALEMDPLLAMFRAADAVERTPAAKREVMKAANFLMPEEGVKAFLRSALRTGYKNWIGGENLPEAAGLAAHFGVSFEAMVYRLRAGGVI